MGKMTAKPSSAAAAAVAIAFLCCFLAIAEGEKLKTFQREYGPFNETHYQFFEVEKPATISNDALQVTPDSASANFILTNLSGRVLLKQSFKLWADDIGSNSTQPRVASFNTSFLINVFRPKSETPGEGLAFVIAPDLELPANSSGQFLGLTNSSTDGLRSNKLVAVELDTFKQEFDPDDNHVGININSVRSIETAPLAPHNITIAPIGARFYNVWVDYSGDNMVMQVYIAEQEEKYGPTPPKPLSPILSAWDLNLMDHVNQFSYFGFSASTGETTQLNCVLRWNLTVNYFAGGEDKWLKIVLGAGVPVLVLLLISAIGLGYYCHRRRVALSNPNLVGALKSLPGMPREFEFRALKKATNGFDERHKLGQGGYGVVYRGVLVKEDMEIAVKWFSRESIKGQDDFLAELTIINRLRHKHLVKLLGWCHKYGKLLLVYEYMPKGSLDKHLFAGPNVEPLGWNLRYKIIAGVASALHYLHNEYDQRVVHRDLKASNIMLDSNFNARLGDFGLARALDNEKTSYAEAEGVLGTMGYIAPECFHTGKATQQSDVYAFGAVILEVVCGQRPGAKIAGFQFLVDWVWLLHRDGRLLEAVDQRLGDDYVPEEAQRLLLLGLACSHPTASERPKTQAIVQIISGTVPVPIVPPFKPAFVWPASGPIDLDLDSGSVGTASTVTTSHFGSGWTPQYLSRESYTGYSDSMV
ncbi:putative L-type lectin-domain containing receptor kinase S.5 [Sesamum angolense]|uniref:non-specific serine/threonine protein kinase n=1 Tax=Sesamum angolense TaxID=2727404 RepID=A0AAE1T9H7_9LAMI|nr:putative L-type lectin-domain containing receptor kinase S.5 [Sesamum angolense]